MNADLTPDALDALVSCFRAGACEPDERCRDMRASSGCHCAHAADAITALRAENEALTARATAAEAKVDELSGERVTADNALVDRYRDPRTGIFKFPCDVASIVRRLDAAEAALAAAMASLRSISATVSWEINPSNYTHDQVCELNASWIEIGCIADAALEPNPAAQDRGAALIKATLERAAKSCDKIAGNTADFSRDHRRAAGQCAAMIRGLATQPQTDALAARDAKMRAEGMRKVVGMIGERIEQYGLTMTISVIAALSSLQSAILEAAQKEAEA